MKANPGGQIDLKDVIGRYQLLQHIWDTLERQSIRINAERRIGKTTIIRKLEAEPRPGWTPILQDLEQYHTAWEFAQGVYQRVDRFLSASQRAARRGREVIKAVSGTEIGGVLKLPQLVGDQPWKALLSGSIEDLIEEQRKQNKRPIFLWDEFHSCSAASRTARARRSRWRFWTRSGRFARPRK